jgi:hypothetical protein
MTENSEIPLVISEELSNPRNSSYPVSFLLLGLGNLNFKFPGIGNGERDHRTIIVHPVARSRTRTPSNHRVAHRLSSRVLFT